MTENKLAQGAFGHQIVEFFAEHYDKNNLPVWAEVRGTISLLEVTYELTFEDGTKGLYKVTFPTAESNEIKEIGRVEEPKPTTKEVQAIDLQVGDQFMHNEELYRVTANKETYDHKREIFTYVVERPRTAPHRFYYQPDDLVTINVPTV